MAGGAAVAPTVGLPLDELAAAIPKDLVELDQWVIWRHEDGRKRPYSARGYKADTTAPAHWCGFAEAVAAWRAAPARYAGIGFVFSPDDPFVGVDLDDCLTEDSQAKPWAGPIIERFADTYIEVSPSGTGVKIWCRGKLAGSGLDTRTNDGGIEMYCQGRYFTVTGCRFNGAPLQVEDHQSDISALELHLRRPGRAAVASDGKIPHGKQHYTLVSLAGTLRRRGVCVEAIEACLQEVNARQCEQPGPRQNITRIAHSAGRWPA